MYHFFFKGTGLLFFFFGSQVAGNYITSQGVAVVFQGET